MSATRPGSRLPALVVASLLALVVAASFAARTFQFLRLPAGAERVVFASPDSLYHLRFAKETAAQFPRPPRFDWYLNYPLGAPIQLPPFQGLLGAAVANLFGGGARAVEIACFLYPAVVGAATPLLVFALARLLGIGAGGSVVAAALFPLVPAQFNYTVAGQFDHHAGDMALSLAWLAALLGIWRTRAAPIRGALAPVGLGALALAAAHLNFLGAILHAFVTLVLVLAGGALLAARDPRVPAFVGRTAAAMAGAAAVHALSLAALEGPARVLQVAYNLPSGFQSLALAGAALALAVGGLFAARGRAALRSPWVWAGAALGVGLLALTGGSLASGLARYFTERPGTMQGVLENISPFRLGGLRSSLARPSLRSGAGFLTYLVLVVPPALVWLARRGVRPGAGRDFPTLLLVGWAAVQTGLAAHQSRYGILFAAPAAIVAGWLVETLWREARRTGAPRARRAAAGAAAAGCLLSVLPGLQPLRVRMNNPYAGVLNVDLARPMAWLATATPDPGGGFDPGRRPAYGVMAYWDQGYNVIGQGGRPCIVTGYLDELPGGLFAEAQRFFLEKDPAAARDIMARNDLRYLLLRNLPDTLAQIGGAPIAADPASADPRSIPATLRLWSVQGSAALIGGEPIPATGHFRLLREDEFYYHRSQIYELVPAARLTGTAAPGALVVGSIPLVSGGGRPFLYQELARAGHDGVFSLPAPYASLGPNGTTRPTGPWKVAVYPAGPRTEVAVAEQDVLAGAAVAVALEPAAARGPGAPAGSPP